MSSLLDRARHEVGRLRAISRALSDLKLPVIKDEADQLEVLVWSMRRNLEERPPEAEGRPRAGSG